MEQQSQPPPTNSTPSTPQPPEQQQQQPQPPPSSTTTTTSSQPVTLNPTKPTTTAQQQNPTLQNPQQTTTRQPQTFNNNNRPWQQQQQQQQQQQPSPFQHFSLPPPPPPPPPHSSSSSSSSSTSVSVQNPRGGGGMAMGVPAHHPSSSFSSLTQPSFGQPTSTTTSQVRQPIQGMHGMGMMGSLGSTSPMRGPAGVPPQHLRPVPSSLRPQTSISSQSAATQNFQGHGMLRVQSVGFPSSQSHTTTTSQSPRSLNQPWLSSGGPGKPPLPTTPSLRPQISPQSLHQNRSHIHSPHQQHTVTTTTSSAQQSQPSTSSQSHDHLGPQMPPSRIQQSLSNQALGRGPGLGIQRPSSSHALMQSTAVQPGPPSKAATTLEVGDPCNRILSKRSIQEIVTQIDPSEKLDAEVEDILVDIAEEFVESITTFGCSLAKHRKSNTLEAKDILLHLERNWNMTLPGFGGDEIRTYKKPFTSDIHKERIAAIKKSALAAEMTNAKGSGQAGGNMKSHLAKGAANILGSPPNAKT
ncbi:transcription initiation factor TFIID subunit 12 [Lycium barbarum]|uniref:transcription initiation factor TFIID subunit 12 n=1 Tax=Lycium barbarum TaxID=112863 RepID=UPI00293F1904|nr:transcription initiation factor TFIID subunit 12 [Lycium barbarum]